jgi:hypothetical protein
VILAIWRLTAVCAKLLPMREEPVLNKTSVNTKRTPCIDAPAPILALPATCQKMFFACTPPDKSTFLFVARVRIPVVCTMKTSSVPPSKVMSELMSIFFVKV